jgi:hypothetical protein
MAAVVPPAPHTHPASSLPLCPFFPAPPGQGDSSAAVCLCLAVDRWPLPPRALSLYTLHPIARTLYSPPPAPPPRSSISYFCGSGAAASSRARSTAVVPPNAHGQRGGSPFALLAQQASRRPRPWWPPDYRAIAVVQAGLVLQGEIQGAGARPCSFPYVAAHCGGGGGGEAGGGVRGGGWVT